MFDHFPFLAAVLATAALTITPGLDTVLVLRNSARGGFWDGFLTGLGIGCGLFVHATVSALGLSLLLLQSALLFSLLKYAGAAYLCWIGLQSLLSFYRGEQLVASVNSSEQASLLRPPLWHSYRTGLLTNLLNPKLVVFYMMFLPQFVDPGYPALPQSLMVAGIHFVLGLVWSGGIAWLMHSARQLVSRPAFARVLNGIAGCLLFGFGIKLALFQR